MKRISVILIIQFILLTFCACSEGLYINGGSTSDGPQLEAIPDNNVAERYATTLYFGMQNEGYLLSEERNVQLDPNQSHIYSVLKALIIGPSKDNCKRLINSNTDILSVTTNNKYVYLSLSKEFLDVPSATEGWQNNYIIADQVYRERRLAIYSIVNTLTVTGEFAYVQFFVDIDNDGVAERISRGDAGFVGDGNESEQLDMLVREHGYIYSPSNAVRLAIDLIAKNQPKRLYDIISRTEEDVKTSYEDFLSIFSQANCIIGDYSVDEEISVSNFGNTFTVMVDYAVKTKGSNNAIIYNDIPVKVLRNDNTYLVDMDFVENILKG